MASLLLDEETQALEVWLLRVKCLNDPTVNRWCALGDQSLHSSTLLLSWEGSRLELHMIDYEPHDPPRSQAEDTLGGSEEGY